MSSGSNSGSGGSGDWFDTPNVCDIGSCACSGQASDAETDLTRARFEVVDATIDLRTAAVRFAHALGRDSATEETDAKR